MKLLILFLLIYSVSFGQTDYVTLKIPSADCYRFSFKAPDSVWMVSCDGETSFLINPRLSSVVFTLQMRPNSSASWQDAVIVENGNSVSLAIAISVGQTIGTQIAFEIPAGWEARINQATVGTFTSTWVLGWDVYTEQ